MKKNRKAKKDRGKRKSLKQNVLQAITYLAMVWIIKRPQTKIDRLRKKAPRRKKKVVREETGLLDLDGAEEWRDEEETAVPPVIKSADILSSEDAEAFNPDEEEIFDDSFFDEEEEKPHRRTKRKKKQGSKSPVKWLKL